MRPSAWCEHLNSQVIESRLLNSGIRMRERECRDCGATFITKEVRTGDCRDLMREARHQRLRRDVSDLFAGA